MTIDNCLNELFQELLSRQKSGKAETSYTAKLLAEGTEKIVKKVTEEALEVSLAAMNETKDSLINESADLIYHLMVLWLDKGITPEEIAKELSKRKGISGIEEKNSRAS